MEKQGRDKRKCGMCERREHKTGKGICQFCWGSGKRFTELSPREGEICIHCVAILPSAPIFCIHGGQMFDGCKECKSILQLIGKIDGDGSFELMMEFVPTHQVFRIGMKPRKTEMSKKLIKIIKKASLEKMAVD